MTSCAPRDSGHKMSASDASKLTDVDCSIRSSAVMLHSAVKDTTCSAIAACATATPFGRPVDPDV
ncbi:Uncharacterised protein [Mycobacteroides abscessus subsp. abscessus]|nr:Uncharacterised protein [Mycobacteroides abscessus subsp. abscessus]SKT59691.1 Uncharacterised protein [Mycobacteroides abscessus subsp. abscessus]SKU08830.1 Uncharacterised protein [Mycobacteroides abscessus subsp. abscessus]